LREALGWYHDIRPELSHRFTRAVEMTINAVAENPLHFPVVYRERRRAGVRRFPYGLFFEIQEHRIVVIACFHAKRNPSRWQDR
jgi:plasmid stabilization system protein ParE